MIFRLHKNDHKKVRPLFRELEWNLIIDAVIDGTSPGRVYADHHEDPRTAQGHFRAKRYNEAIERYEKFFATPEKELPKWFLEDLPQELSVHYFRVAYANASIGENNEALKYLEKAIDNGWLHIDFLKNCKIFGSMHGTPAWNHILEKIQKKLARASME